MKDVRRAAQKLGQVTAQKVALEKSESCIPQQTRKIMVFELPGIVIEKIVDADDFVPGVEQSFRQMRANKTGDACNHRFHGHLLLEAKALGADRRRAAKTFLIRGRKMPSRPGAL
jgi:hypothetical protein